MKDMKRTGECPGVMVGFLSPAVSCRLDRRCSQSAQPVSAPAPA